MDAGGPDPSPPASDGSTGGDPDPESSPPATDGSGSGDNDAAAEDREGPVGTPSAKRRLFDADGAAAGSAARPNGRRRRIAPDKV
uniref:Uncharacterized protein n=1 Tax=Leersia perrieri TaxID=77586 RepID=A0A0D9XQF0_9ORYZ